MGLRVQGGKACFLQNISLENLPVFLRNVKAMQAFTQFIVSMKLTLGPAPVDFERGTKCPIFTQGRADIIQHGDTWKSFYQAKAL